MTSINDLSGRVLLLSRFTLSRNADGLLSVKEDTSSQIAIYVINFAPDFGRVVNGIRLDTGVKFFGEVSYYTTLNGVIYDYTDMWNNDDIEHAVQVVGYYATAAMDKNGLWDIAPGEKSGDVFDSYEEALKAANTHFTKFTKKDDKH